MAGDGDPSHDEPFDALSSIPMFAELAKVLRGQGPLNWEAARQFAMLGATEGAVEHNVDPAVRITFADLGRIAGMHVNDVTGAEIAFPEPSIVTPGQWTTAALEAYRPLFTELATSLGQQPAADVEVADPVAQMLTGLSRMMAPAMMGMAVGSMVGGLARRVFGVHDLPIPRPRQEMMLVAATIDGFATAWEIPLDEMRLWVVAHECSGHQLFANADLREALATLVRHHVAGFRPDPTAVAERLSDLDALGAGDDPTAALQGLLGDPTVLLGAVQSPEQLALQPRLDAAVAAVVGYTDWVVDAVAARLIGAGALRIAEAVRRQRASVRPEEVFVERLLGIRLDDSQVTRGKQFVQGVVDRVGETGLTRLLALPDALPTPNEIDAPGLWVARVGSE